MVCDSNTIALNTQQCTSIHRKRETVDVGSANIRLLVWSELPITQSDLFPGFEGRHSEIGATGAAEGIP